MPRKSRPLDRTTGGLRDTSIVVVACEDTHAVKQYFAKFRTRRIQYKILPTESGHSSPRAVIDRLNSCCDEYAQEDGDELWLCIDADHWIRSNHQRELSQVLRECRQKNYGIAISNPCFEVWLLLHFVDNVDGLLTDVLGKPRTANVTPEERASLRCSEFESHLRVLADGYNKANVCMLDISASQVRSAVARAKNSDTASGDVPHLSLIHI